MLDQAQKKDLHVADSWVPCLWFVLLRVPFVRSTLLVCTLWICRLALISFLSVVSSFHETICACVYESLLALMELGCDIRPGWLRLVVLSCSFVGLSSVMFCWVMSWLSLVVHAVVVAFCQPVLVLRVPWWFWLWLMGCGVGGRGGRGVVIVAWLFDGLSLLKVGAIVQSLFLGGRLMFGFFVCLLVSACVSCVILLVAAACMFVLCLFLVGWSVGLLVASCLFVCWFCW